MKNLEQSWEEKNEEALKISSKLRLGAKWTLGFFQVIPDTETPVTKLSNNNFKEFLVPDKYLSLKLFFDNIRNYGICAAFIAFGVWVWKQSPALLPSQTPAWLPISASIAIWVLTAVLLLLNCSQTWIITSELYFSLTDIRTAKSYIYRGNKSIQIILSFLHILSTIALELVFSIAALFVVFSIIAISIGFVSHTVILK